MLKLFETQLLGLNFEDALSFINDLPRQKIDPDELIKVTLVVTALLLLSFATHLAMLVALRVSGLTTDL